MKGKELIEFIQKNQLEDFDLKFTFQDGNGYMGFPNYKRFKITEIADVGYSDKVVVLEGEEIF